MRTMDPSPKPLPPGSSLEQREAERYMLDALGDGLGGVILKTRTFKLSITTKVVIDGVDDSDNYLVECWAHQGPPKPAQRHKVLADALKLFYLARFLGTAPTLILCMSDAAAAAPFRPNGRSWASLALDDLRVQVQVVDIPPDIRAHVAAAQLRQVMRSTEPAD
jgi:hypothetical protein